MNKANFDLSKEFLLLLDGGKFFLKNDIQ